MTDKYNAERFLDKLYQNLYKNVDIKSHSKSKFDDIKKYLIRLKRIHSNASTNSRKEILKHLYYEKYVIKENKIRNGLDKEQIIEDQKMSLDKWLEYLSTVKYPMWVKYWIFQGMIRMGSFDYENNVYNKRSEKTLSPFIEVNNEIIENSVYFITKVVNNAEINDKIVEEIVKTGSFQKIYTFFENKYKNNLMINSNSLNGIWIKYNMGNYEDAIKLYKSLEGKNTHWCSVHQIDAVRQICGNKYLPGGDFYAYYTKNIDGEYAIPRLAIRLIGHDRIAEIRGIAESQCLEREMELVLEHKLQEMTFLSKKEYNIALEKLEDLKELTSIDNKILNNIPLTEKEIADLYIKKFGFGLDNDSRVKKIIKTRNIIKDYQQLTDILDKAEIFSKYFYEFPMDFKIKNSSIALEIIVVNGSLIRYVDNSLIDNPDFVLEAVRTNGWIVKNLSYKWQNDPEIIKEAIKENINILQYATDELKNNKKFMFSIVETDDRAIELAGDKLKKDPKFIKVAQKAREQREIKTENLKILKKNI